MPACPHCESRLDLAELNYSSPACPHCGAKLSLLNSTAEPTTEATSPSTIDLAPAVEGFEMIRHIGRGGMGDVWEARQNVLQRTVAIKVLAPRLSKSKHFHARFTREAVTLGRLQHPGIVSIFDFRTTGDLCCIIMEYIEGPNRDDPVSLHQLIRGKQLDVEKSRTLMIEVLEALQFAHEEHVVHRDIKPSNILVTRFGRAKVVDFGIASMNTEDTTSQLTHAGGPLGTAEYMAPEQTENAADADHRADIYACGVVLYEMLTGMRPRGMFRMPSRIVAGLNPVWDEIIFTAMQTDRDDRYPNADAMIEALRNVNRAVVPPTVAAPGFHSKPGPPIPVEPGEKGVPQTEDDFIVYEENPQRLMTPVPSSSPTLEDSSDDAAPTVTPATDQDPAAAESRLTSDAETDPDEAAKPPGQQTPVTAGILQRPLSDSDASAPPANAEDEPVSDAGLPNFEDFGIEIVDEFGEPQSDEPVSDDSAGNKDSLEIEPVEAEAEEAEPELDDDDAEWYEEDLEDGDEFLLDRRRPGPSRKPAESETAMPYRPAARPPMLLLTFVDDDQTTVGETIRIRQPRFVIGREDGDYVLPYDQMLSSKHIEISRTERGGGRFEFKIRDLSTSNGTFARAARAPLEDGQRLLLGMRRYQLLQNQPTKDGPRDMLVELTARGPGKRFVLTKSPTIIGRDPTKVGMVLLGDAFISPVHAIMKKEKRKNRWVIKNRGSRNGVWIGVDEVPLSSGGAFMIGSQRISVEIL